MDTLPVIFRKGRAKDGEVTAVFPTLPADRLGRYMTCYTHIGQHGRCGLGWYNTTRAARPEDYADLLAELRDIYERDEDEPVKLVVYSRMQPAHRKAFTLNLERQNAPI